MTAPHAQCRGCKTMVIGGAVDALPLIGWVFDAAGWVCPTCETAPRCPTCDGITTARGVLCPSCQSPATDRPRCGCTRAAVDDQGVTCSLCTVDVLNDEALRAAPLPREARPTVPFPRCPCGGALDPQHRCVDPVGDVVALHIAADDADERLDPPQRIEVRRRLREHHRQRTAERLARGPG